MNSPLLSDASASESNAFISTSPERRKESSSEQDSSARGTKRSRYTSSSTSSGSFTNRPKSSLPEQVSKWKRNHGEKVGIFYAKDCVNGLEGLIHHINGTVIEFTQEEKYYMEFVDNFLTFSLTLANFYKNYPEGESRAHVEIGRDDANIKGQEEESLNLFATVKLKIFINCLRRFHRNIRYYKVPSKTSPIAEGLLTHLIGAFADLCCLTVEYCNEACKAVWSHLYGNSVVSKPDLRLFKCGIDYESSDAVVSVTQVKPNYDDNNSDQLRKKRRGSPRMSTVVSDVETEENEIALDVHDSALGQHAGALLCDLHLEYRAKKRNDYEEDKKMNMLGMIVEGSMVYFTLLEMTWKHYQKLKSNQKLDPDDKATIHYTSPKNFLLKPERTSLMVDFMRLNKIHLRR